ncbi:DUF2069 domain-containing protein [Marinobacterium rhizophilum]|uniref:DUF2069 domain-containing protein n=1 Tax=Marinobacterium rhizophilum TaxID=420402 RepID=A0ABY5HQ52_9GAMM|nr:DUF2069 domain-containing protein [Marinobacterium rhizophilum]UTW13337.1 DUF2069 domain-containing protein [Marinobacterium rhizophilum]
MKTTLDSNLDAKLRMARLLTLTSYAALLSLLSAWYLWLAPAPGDRPWIVWLWHLVPLLAFAPSVLLGKPRAHAWLCFVLLLFFIEAVLAATHPATFGLGLSYAILVSVLFSAAMYYARWKSQWLRSNPQR